MKTLILILLSVIVSQAQTDTLRGQKTIVLDNSNFDSEYSILWNDGIVQKGSFLISPQSYSGLSIYTALLNENVSTSQIWNEGQIYVISSRDDFHGIQCGVIGPEPLVGNYTPETLIPKKYVDNKHPILDKLSYDPNGVIDGYLYLNTTTNKLRIKINGSWFSLLVE